MVYRVWSLDDQVWTSPKTAAKIIVSQCIQFCVHSFAKKVFEFLHGVAGEKNKVPKRLRTLDKYDILGLVFRPRLEAWCNEEVVDPTTLRSC